MNESVPILITDKKTIHFLRSISMKNQFGLENGSTVLIST
jgi:hypothetical protein